MHCTSGRCYISVLSEEIIHLSRGNYPSDRLIVFSTVVLQCYKLVQTGIIIQRTLNGQMSMWEESKFHILVQEANRCYHNIGKYNRPTHDSKHTAKIFSRLMLHGKLGAAMHRLTKRSKGHVLQPNHQVRLVIDGQEKSVSIPESLKMKHPSPMLPHSSSLLAPDHLPEFEDLDITGGHIHQVAHRIQSGARPGGCDSAHWQDAVLHYGSGSYRL